MNVSNKKRILIVADIKSYAIDSIYENSRRFFNISFCFEITARLVIFLILVMACKKLVLM